METIWDERYWSDLPPELIHLISKKLPDLRDFIRFRAVCKSWCVSAPLSDPPPQLPWVLEHRSLMKNELTFYSISTGETGTIHVEESRCGKAYRGPCGGYLLIRGAWGTAVGDPYSYRWNAEENSVVLFNPLTNADITLPPVPSHCISSVWPVWNGSDPILSRNIVFVDKNRYTFGNPGCWAVYHAGETEWTVKQGFFYNSCYWDGMIFTTTIFEGTEVYDCTSQKLLYSIPLPKGREDICNKSYLVEVSGVIMRVFWYLSWGQSVKESIFHIYKLNFEGRNGPQPSWVEVSSIGDHMLFLDEENGFSLKSTAGSRGNCIYFFNYRGGTPYRYDITAGTFERLPCSFKASTWFVPTLL